MDSAKTSVKLWFDGNVMPVDEATIPVTWISPRMASAVFDGIRAYWNADRKQLYVFRLEDHMARFSQARHVLKMECAWTDEELTEATLEILRINGFQEDAYVAPTAFFGVDTAAGGTPTLGKDAHITITPRRWPSSLGGDIAIECAVSSWVRIPDHVMPPRVKCIANYHNYRLATLDAWRQGCDHFFSAIMLNSRGKVAEGAMASLFLIRDGRVIVPSVSSDILESITRATVMELCAGALGLEVVEREVDRTELYIADELFLCGTGSEMIPVRSIDEYTVGDGNPGPITRQIVDLYEKVVRGTDDRYGEWRTPV